MSAGVAGSVHATGCARLPRGAGRAAGSASSYRVGAAGDGQPARPTGAGAPSLLSLLMSSISNYRMRIGDLNVTVMWQGRDQGNISV